MQAIRGLLRATVLEFGRTNRSGLQGISPRRTLSTWDQDVDEMSAEYERRLSRRIHILGIGNVGTFVAHSLKSQPSPPPITLMLHNPLRYSSWLAGKECLAINTNGLDDIKSGFDVNVFYNENWRSIPISHAEDRSSVDSPSTTRSTAETEHQPNPELLGAPEDNGEIECLILTVKAPVTVAALQQVRHRLTPNSTVLFLQNGMGTIDEVNEKVFPNRHRRPHYAVGIFSHGLRRLQGPFRISHNGVGTTILGPILPQISRSRASDGGGDKEPDWPLSTKYLLRTLTLTPPLVAVAEPPSSVLMHQLEKLAMNSIINPLTALLDCRNGELLHNMSATRLMRLLLFEISSVICSLPELQSIPGIESRFAPERLLGMATQLADKTARNLSSMLQDVRSHQTTEIEYLNGYIVRRGEDLGIKCVVNYTIKHLVLAKQLALRQRDSRAIPIDAMDKQ